MYKIIACFLSLIFLSSEAFALVRITNMNNFAFGTWSGSGQLQTSDAVCIHDSSVNMNYGIRMRGSGASFAFTVANGVNTIAYTMAFQGSVGGMTAMTTNIKTVFNDANRVSQTCGGGTNATIRVTFSQAALEAAEGGLSYTGTLTVLLTAT